eukprot:1196360-Prorocentrum_minimum.AAC.4
MDQSEPMSCEYTCAENNRNNRARETRSSGAEALEPAEGIYPKGEPTIRGQREYTKGVNQPHEGRGNIPHVPASKVAHSNTLRQFVRSPRLVAERRVDERHLVCATLGASGLFGGLRTPHYTRPIVCSELSLCCLTNNIHPSAARWGRRPGLTLVAVSNPKLIGTCSLLRSPSMVFGTPTYAIARPPPTPGVVPQDLHTTNVWQHDA